MRHPLRGRVESVDWAVLEPGEECALCRAEREARERGDAIDPLPLGVHPDRTLNWWHGRRPRTTRARHRK